MNEETSLNHVALQFQDSEKAEIFFTKILGLSLKKNFTISPELSNNIFGIKENVEIHVYENQDTSFEVFITKQSKKPGYMHTCIEIKNKEEFMKRCRKYNIEPIMVEKNGKKLLFIRDFSNNLYEIKEKQS